MRNSQIFLITAIIAATPMAFAQNPAPAADQETAGKQDMRPFAQLDKNQDGQLTQAELPAASMHSQHFAKIDVDGNASLSKTEVDRHLVEDMGMKPGDMAGMNHDMKCMEGMEGMEDMKCMEGMKDMKGMEHGDMEMGADEGDGN